MHMQQARIYLFTSMTCPHCPVAKKGLDELRKQRSDIDAHELPLHTPQAQHLAKQFGVQSVPTFIIQGQKHEGNIGLVGSQSQHTLNKYVDIALGKRSQDPPSSNSVFTRLKKRLLYKAKR